MFWQNITTGHPSTHVEGMSGAHWQALSLCPAVSDWVSQHAMPSTSAAPWWHCCGIAAHRQLALMKAVLWSAPDTESKGPSRLHSNALTKHQQSALKDKLPAFTSSASTARGGWKLGWHLVCFKLVWVQVRTRVDCFISLLEKSDLVYFDDALLHWPTSSTWVSRGHLLYFLSDFGSGHSYITVCGPHTYNNDG